MPITVTAPTGTFTESGEREILPRLTAALLDISGGTGNAFFTGIIGGTVHLLPPHAIYAGGVNRRIVMVELKLPNIGLPDTQSRATFVTAATDIVDALTNPGHNRADTWVNIVNAPDGGWGIGGRAYTGDALISAVAAGMA
ncbi:4-oxalocrotonate tautomerase family protein [Nocardia sp. NPDC052566]|uniref:4-oxalocrotonate tautomerase family protein n=1 Tax=Nocardia sp. NPDC052566 TaxID=3364330 RepID=UPI0037C657C5